MLVRKETAKAAKGGRRGKRLISAVGKCMATTYARGTARASGGFEAVHAGMFPESNRAGLITALHIIMCFAFTAGGGRAVPPGVSTCSSGFGSGICRKKEGRI